MFRSGHVITVVALASWFMTASTGPAHAETVTSFWSFQPPRNLAVPAVRDAAWPRSPIDRFILAELEDANIAPVADADRRSLLRRASFALTGLPPSPAEMDRFVQDTSPLAFTNVVDRLLAAPQFGERWGRHWLDIARFAESSGGGRSLIFQNAWRYRDYVIDAFNRDKPYDKFLTEQIAGDLLPYDTPAQRHEQLIATGFLAVGAKNLDHQDKELLRMDVVDEQIDTLGQAVLGMTVGCARCHEHKFDPIPTTDYYALAGILRSTKTLLPGNVSGFVERPLYRDAAHRRAVEQHQKVIKPIETQLGQAKSKLKRVRTELAALQDPTQSAGAVDDDAVEAQRDKVIAAEKLVKRVEAEHKALEDKAPEPPRLAIGVRDEEEPADYHVCIRGNIRDPGAKVARGALSAASTGEPCAVADGGSGRRELAAWLTRCDNPLTARVIVNRVWHHLFGTGLVRTIDNFGKMGEPPSHPELLDWLAVRFVEQGWSIKTLIRELMLSRVYQLSTTHDGRAHAVDPENRLGWRMNRHRLEAEAIRDAILTVSGRLDLRCGGKTIRRGTESEFEYTFSTTAPYRRGVYTPIFRNAPHGFFAVFDFADTNLVTGRRNTSTLPTQALYLMNSDFVMDEARFAADLLLARRGLNNDQRLDRAYRLTLGRAPTEAERTLAVRFLDDSPGTDAWAGLFQSLFSCVDFRYVN